MDPEVKKKIDWLSEGSRIGLVGKFQGRRRTNRKSVEAFPWTHPSVRGLERHRMGEDPEYQGTIQG